MQPSSLSIFLTDGYNGALLLSEAIKNRDLTTPLAMPQVKLMQGLICRSGNAVDTCPNWAHFKELREVREKLEK